MTSRGSGRPRNSAHRAPLPRSRAPRSRRQRRRVPRARHANSSLSRRMRRRSTPTTAATRARYRRAGPASWCGRAATPNFLNLNPLLAAQPGSNGGPTPTYQISAAAVATMATPWRARVTGGVDQRGYLRPPNQCALGTYDPNATRPTSLIADMASPSPDVGAQAIGCGMPPLSAPASATQAAVLCGAAMQLAGWRRRIELANFRDVILGTHRGA